MSLGTFSMSLAVKDLQVSKAFYEKLGFKVFAGDMDKNYLIMKSGETNIGLFQDMFEGNILTFNPGWDNNAQALTEFTDVRVIQQNLVQQGIEIKHNGISAKAGPANIVLIDPDGNTILIDQHV